MLPGSTRYGSTPGLVSKINAHSTEADSSVGEQPYHPLDRLTVEPASKKQLQMPALATFQSTDMQFCMTASHETAPAPPQEGEIVANGCHDGLDPLLAHISSDFRTVQSSVSSPSRSGLPKSAS